MHDCLLPTLSRAASLGASKILNQDAAKPCSSVEAKRAMRAGKDAPGVLLLSCRKRSALGLIRRSVRFRATTYKNPRRNTMKRPLILSAFIALAGSALGQDAMQDILW